MSDDTFLDILRNQPLSRGWHLAPEKGTCIMEKVSLLWAVHAGLDVTLAFSDLPKCTNQVVARVARVVNDRLGDTERQKLTVFIPRLLRARRTQADKLVDRRVAAAVCRFAVEHLPDDTHGSMKDAFLAAEACLLDPNDENWSVVARATEAASWASTMWEAAELIALLDQTLDAWEEAVTKETTEDLYTPQDWEDDALAFVAEMMGREETE